MLYVETSQPFTSPYQLHLPTNVYTSCISACVHPILFLLPLAACSRRGSQSIPRTFFMSHSMLLSLSLPFPLASQWLYEKSFSVKEPSEHCIPKTPNWLGFAPFNEERHDAKRRKYNEKLKERMKKE